MSIKVINYLKDGTVVDDMSNVTVSKEVVEHMMMILERKNNYEKKSKKKTHETTC